LSLMGKSNNRVFVYKDMPDISTKKNIDIILTPQLYIFLKEDLEIKFKYQAKQIAPSLFDDYIENEESYQFFVYKRGKFWYFFAFNIEEILSLLEEKGLKKYQIGKIYFAQELIDNLEDDAIELGDNSALIDIDEIVTFVPKKILNKDIEYLDLNLNRTSLKNGVSIGNSYSLISFKHTVMLSFILLMFGAIYLLEAYRLKEAIEKEEKRVEELLDRNPRLSSNRIRKSILEKFEPIDRIERLKRESINKISKVLSPNVYIKELSVDDKRVSALIGSNNFKYLNGLLRNKNLKDFKVKKESGSIRVEREFN